jgi:microcystin-dependent protein
MATFSYPNSITKDTPALASEVQDNFDAVQQFAEDEPMHSDGTNPITVPLILPGDPTADNHAANKGYVDTVFPIGTIIEYAPDELPDGTTTDPDWAWCDGSVQTITDPRFTDLFNKIGIRYGGDGITNFGLPDKAGRVGVGRDTGDVDFDTVGNTGGSKALALHSHTLDSHDHTINHGHADSFSAGNEDAVHDHPVSINSAYETAHEHVDGIGGKFVMTGIGGDPDNLVASGSVHPSVIDIWSAATPRMSRHLTLTSSTVPSPTTVAARVAAAC